MLSRGNVLQRRLTSLFLNGRKCSEQPDRSARKAGPRGDRWPPRSIWARRSACASMRARYNRQSSALLPRLLLDVTKRARTGSRGVTRPETASVTWPGTRSKSLVTGKSGAPQIAPQIVPGAVSFETSRRLFHLQFDCLGLFACTFFRYCFCYDLITLSLCDGFSGPICTHS